MGFVLPFAFDNLVLQVSGEGRARDDLTALLPELCWTPLDSSLRDPDLRILISQPCAVTVPSGARELFSVQGFTVFETADELFVSDGSSMFRLQGREGAASLDSTFFARPVLLQSNFWCFGLLKLMRPFGIYSLHAAALMTPEGQGMLLVGPPGSGKSTLAIGLVREGWRYLSDDAVLLSERAGYVDALACRRSFFIDAIRSADYAEFKLSAAASDSAGRPRCRVDVDGRFARQHVSRCRPGLLIFPQIRRQEISMLDPIDPISTLQILLSQSAPQLFDRRTMDRHLRLLQQLIGQTKTYRLSAGLDLYREPAKLIRMLADSRNENSCRVSSSN